MSAAGTDQRVEIQGEDDVVIRSLADIAIEIFDVNGYHEFAYMVGRLRFPGRNVLNLLFLSIDNTIRQKQKHLHTN